MEISRPYTNFPDPDWQEARPQDVGMNEMQLSLMQAHIQWKINLCPSRSGSHHCNHSIYRKSQKR